MREIIFDTETTGFDPAGGDRLVEIGCIEAVNRIPTGRTFHRYVNPERDMPEAAFRVHGLSADFLSKHPVFSEIAADFLDFAGDAPLVAHNAEFDMKFINWELKNAGHPAIAMSRMVDTLVIARSRFPGAQNSLDALCKRFGIDNSSRDLHGALLDARLLAEVYLELTGGRQTGLALAPADSGGREAVIRPYREPRPHAPSDEELAAHAAFIARLDNAIWSR